MSVTGIARDAATAAGFGDRPPPRATMRLMGFKPIDKGNLLGLARIALPCGLTIHDVLILRGRDGQPWASLPGRPMIDREGRHAEIDGRKQFSAVVEWQNRDLRTRFSAKVVELVRRKYPAALPPAEDEAAE